MLVIGFKCGWVCSILFTIFTYSFSFFCLFVWGSNLTWCFLCSSLSDSLSEDEDDEDDELLELLLLLLKEAGWVLFKLFFDECFELFETWVVESPPSSSDFYPFDGLFPSGSVNNFKYDIFLPKEKRLCFLKIYSAELLIREVMIA